jgi:hypothetical protein
MTEIPLHEMRSTRWMPSAVERALNAALTRGHGYEPIPRGANFDRGSVRGYYLDFRSKTRSPTAQALDVLPAIQLIQLGLGWWELHLAGEPGARDRFLELCAAIEARGVSDGDGFRWPIGAEVAKYRLAPGWTSALSQSQGASLFVRAHIATGEDRYGELARRAARLLLDDASSELVTVTRAGPVLEEAPASPPAHILNGWMAALWGLWDVHVGLGGEHERRVFDASVRCLVEWLPSYDTGWWSLYSLYPHAIQDLAKPFYHRLHIDQLDVLHELTGLSAMRETADRWRAYDTPSHRAAAVAQKAAFMVADSRRRSHWRSAG